MITITTYARIHICLLAMSEGGYRKNGGIGFSISNPCTRICAKKSTKMRVLDRRNIGLSQDEQSKLEKILESVASSIKAKSPISVEIGGTSPTHMGFGSGTAIHLAAIECLARSNGLALTRSKIIGLSRRGGTSGIGINTYFHGGLVFDLGRPEDGTCFEPSDSQNIERASSPLVLDNRKMPAWPIGICIPNVKPVATAIEIDFFRNICPLPIEASYEATYHALFGAYAAIRESNYEAYTSSISALQKTTWKSSEWAIHGAELAAIKKQLLMCGANCVGMSSMGPGLFFYASDLQKVLEHATKRLPQCRLSIADPQNSGREIHES